MTDIQPYDTTAELMPLDSSDDGLALLEKQAKAMDAAHRLATVTLDNVMED